MSLFTSGTPTGTVNLDIDFKTLQNNFTQINTSFSKNHVALTDTTPSNGKHTFVEMLSIAKAITFVPGGLAAGEGTFFTNTDALSNVQGFYTDGATGNAYQLTYTTPSKFSLFGENSPYQAAGGGNAAVTGGWTFLPGALIMNYGSATTLNPGGSITVIFANPFPNSIFNVVVTPRTSSDIGGGNHDWDVGGLSKTGFNLVINGKYNAGDTFYFNAIGD